MAYSKNTKLECLMMYRDRIPVSQIARAFEDGPSERIIHKWKENGELTEGKPWKQWRREYEAREIIEAHEREREDPEDDEFYDEAVSELKEAFWNAVKEVKKGNFTINDDTPKKLLATIARLENKGEELDRFQREFVKSVFAVAHEMLPESDFQLFVSRVKDVRNRQLDQLDPDARNRLPVPEN